MLFHRGHLVDAEFSYITSRAVPGHFLHHADFAWFVARFVVGLADFFFPKHPGRYARPYRPEGQMHDESLAQARFFAQIAGNRPVAAKESTHSINGVIALYAQRRLVTQQTALTTHERAQVAVRTLHDDLPLGDWDNAAAIRAVESVGCFFHGFVLVQTSDLGCHPGSQRKQDRSCHDAYASAERQPDPGSSSPTGYTPDDRE